MSKFVYLDFEYNDTAEEILNLVCVTVSAVDTESGEGATKEKYWLHANMSEQLRFNNRIEQLLEDYYFVAYNVIAEASSLLSLPYPPKVEKMKWIDLWIEYRVLLNNHNKTSYGKQLIKGHIRKTHPPSPKWMASSNENASKPEDNYATACFKL